MTTTSNHPWHKRAWIFDLDGTLTQAILDFPAIKRELGLPADQGILEALRHMRGPQLAAIQAKLTDWEREAVRKAKAAIGAATLLAGVKQQGIHMGILTRNKRDHALETLAVTGLANYFSPDFVLGRDEAAPKPDPAGLHHLLQRWQVAPAAACMIGDDDIDVSTGRAAGMITVHITNKPSGADFCYPSLTHLYQIRETHKM